MNLSGRSVRLAIVGLLAAFLILMLALPAHDDTGVARTPEDFTVQQQTARAAQQRAVAQRIAALPQPFAGIIESMNRRDPQLGTDGVRHRLDSLTGISPSDGLYLYDLVRQVQPLLTVEVGFAEGFSAMYLLAALQANGKGFHVAIDPFEISDWRGMGLQKVREAGMTSRFRFMEAYSIAALPALKAEGRAADIIFVDGDHRFDAVFADFVLSDAVCAQSCHILLHDSWMPSVQKVIAFIERNRPDYARRAVPAGVNIAALQKVGRDTRDWSHYVEF